MALGKVPRRYWLRPLPLLALFFLLIVCFVFFLVSFRSTTPVSTIPRACTGAHRSYRFCNPSLSLDERLDDLMGRVSLNDKALLLTARASPHGDLPDIGVPEYNWGANCVHGVQSTCGTHCATSFPNPINLGAVFDPQAVFQMAQVIGIELRALWLEGARENYPNGPHLGLDCWSPNININRDPRWGRNMETPSEDPVVNAKYGVAYTRGLQEGTDKRYLQAVVTLKHWIAYSFEHYNNVDRMAFDAIVSKYDFVDTYYPAFRESIVQGHAKGVMCSYNSLNGEPTCANPMLDSILHKTLGFDGYVTSDSGAVEAIYENHHAAESICDAARMAIENGTNICSGYAYRQCLEPLVTSKKLNQSVVDAAVRAAFSLRFKLGLFDPIEDQPYWHVEPSEVNKPAHRALSLEMTRKSMILLQNNKQTLPLAKKIKIAVIGPHGSARKGMMGNYYGQICHGDYNTLDCVQTPLEAIQERNGKASTSSARGCDIKDNSTADFENARDVASQAEVSVLFLGIDTSIEFEPQDRTSIELPSIQIELLKTIRAVSKRVVVVLFNGGILGAERLIENTDALIEAFYPGVYGAQAIADVLFGDVNPSGKLPVTMYQSNYTSTVKMESMNMTTSPGRSHRYYQGTPVFPFGYGLSYTTFALQLNSSTYTDTAPLLITSAISTNLTFHVSNTGTRDGDTVIQCFFRPTNVANMSGPATLLRQQLVDYQRIHIPRKSSALLNFTISDTTFTLVTAHGDRVVLPGTYELVLTDGVDARLSIPVHVATTTDRLIEAFPYQEMENATASLLEEAGMPQHLTALQV